MQATQTAPRPSAQQTPEQKATQRRREGWPFPMLLRYVPGEGMCYRVESHSKGTAHIVKHVSQTQGDDLWLCLTCKASTAGGTKPPRNLGCWAAHFVKQCVGLHQFRCQSERSEAEIVAEYTERTGGNWEDLAPVPALFDDWMADRAAN